jgi:hypothetical protein
MFTNSAFIDHWRLLTPANIQTRQLWGWGYSIQKIVSVSDSPSVPSDDLLILSDYGGEHRSATHLIYCYLVVRRGAHSCLSALKTIRNECFSDRRIMSYKRLSDVARQKALIPFLSAAAHLDGHLVGIAVDKRKRWLSTARDSDQVIRESFRLKSSWNARALEGMMRKAHFASILISLFSRPYTNVTWITDADEFVANDARHDDALLVAARLSSLYVPHPMGVFRLNTTGQDPALVDHEDLCAIPDLAAGMLSDTMSGLSRDGWGEGARKVLDRELSHKADVILEWFFDSTMRLRKTLIAINVEGSRYSVRKVNLLGKAFTDLDRGGPSEATSA